MAHVYNKTSAGGDRRRCLDEWAAAHDAVPTQPKQEAVKKQRATVGTHPTRRRTRRTTKMMAT